MKSPLGILIENIQHSIAAMKEYPEIHTHIRPLEFLLAQNLVDVLIIVLVVEVEHQRVPVQVQLVGGVAHLGGKRTWVFLGAARMGKKI